MPSSKMSSTGPACRWVNVRRRFEQVMRQDLGMCRSRTAWKSARCNVTKEPIMHHQAAAAREPERCAPFVTSVEKLKPTGWSLFL